MTSAQKIFIMAAAMYLIAKAVIGFVFYLVTLRIEQKALEYKHRRQSILRARRLRNLEMYRQQYQALEDRKRRFKAL
ncbi:MAG: hypothetical protein ACM3QZ_00845 [Solirubrobacterales bacterium]